MREKSSAVDKIGRKQVTISEAGNIWHCEACQTVRRVPAKGSPLIAIYANLPVNGVIRSYNANFCTPCMGLARVSQEARSKVERTF